MLKQIWNRLQLLASSGTITLINGNKAQVKVLDEEVLGNIKLVTPFGFGHKPKPGSQAYMVFPAGDRSFGIALIVGDSRYDLELAEGGVGLHDPSGSYVRLNNDGGIELKPSGGTVMIDGDLYVIGAINQGG